MAGVSMRPEPDAWRSWTYDEFDAYVDTWHESDTDLELHEWLHMTFEQYARLFEGRTRLKEYAQKRITEPS